ncbi:MAG: hypothetical protein ACKN82_09045, partial [Pirellula sp.]
MESARITILYGRCHPCLFFLPKMKSAMKSSWVLIGALIVSIFGSVEALRATEPKAPKKIVFIAGGRSHDFGSHEHYAGCRI